MPARSQVTRALEIVSKGLSGAVSVLGLVVIYGWLTNNLALIQVLPTFVPMQFNTALGFLLGGLLLCSRLGLLPPNRTFQLTFAGLLLFLGSVTLLEYVLATDFGLDQLFVDRYITLETSHPGRMAPNTALCFALTGLFGLGAAAQEKREMHLVALTSLVFFLGVVSFCGYLFDIEAAYGWGSLKKMAVHTAAGFIVVGAVSLNYSVSLEAASKAKRPTLPVIVTTGLIAATTVVFQSIRAHQEALIKDIVRSDAITLATQVREALRHNILGLERMAERWQHRRPSRSEWEVDANLYARNLSLKAIGWVDTSNQARWVAPKEGKKPAGFDETGRVALEEARVTRSIVLTSPIQFVRGGHGFLVFVPLFRKGRFDGNILGIMEYNHFFASIFDENELPNRYELAITEGHIPIFSTNVDARRSRHFASASLSIYGRKWMITATPSAKLVAQHDSPGDEIALILGIIVAFLLGVTLYQKEIVQQSRVSEGHDATQKLGRRAIELERSNQAVENSATFLNQIIESMAELLVVTDRNLIIQRVNPMVLQKLGISRSQLIGRSFRQLFDDGEFERIPLESLQSRLKIVNWEARFRTAARSPILVQLSVASILDSSGSLLGFVCIAQDITERKALFNQLGRKQRLESMGQLAAGIAHEINTPIQYVSDNMRYLDEAFNDLRIILGRAHIDEVLFAELPLAIRESLEGVEQVARIVRSMKAFSHPGQEKPVSIDINAAIVNVINICRSEWKHVATLKTELDEHVPPVECFPGEINQVFLNLIVNAAQAVEEANEKLNRDMGEIKVNSAYANNTVVIEIVDSGLGIAMENQDRVFDLFFTTKDVGQGTGQGLAIAHSVIVETHGGALSFESNEGRGTRFVVALPTEAGQCQKLA